MPRPTSIHVCSACGHESTRWAGRCPGCAEWNTLVEQAVRARPAAGRGGGSSAVRPSGRAGVKPVALRDVAAVDRERLSTGIGELDNVLGGGIVPGSLVLLGGSPGIGKSTLTTMVLANLRHLARTGTVPPRDLVFAFFADEEAGGVLGSHYVVDHHPELFEGVGEAISEVGGYSITVPDGATGEPVRAYLLQTAEKGIAWLRLRASGRAGHGSVPNPENAVVRLAAAIARIDAHVWPREYIASVRQLLDGLSALTGVAYADDDADALFGHLGGARGFVMGTLQDTANFTMLDGGYKHNVVPQSATASLDCRFLPGHEDDLMATIAELAGEFVEVEVVHRDIALDAPFGGDLVESMKAALLAEDPGAAVLPYCLSGGTDNKALKQLGITGYGFAPLRLPADLDFAPLFHGVDERVPVDAVRFGARVLQRLVAAC